MDVDEGLRVAAELGDRQEILDCVQRFCRGIDRNDKTLALSAYHPDAVDFHTDAGGAPVLSTALVGPAELELIEHGGTTRDRDDPSYMRPLQIDPPLIERHPIPGTAAV